MKSVSIIEKSTGRVVAIYPVDMTGLHYAPSTQEYEAAAWEAAVDTASVNPDRLSDYSFTLEDVPPSATASPTAD